MIFVFGPGVAVQGGGGTWAGAIWQSLVQTVAQVVPRAIRLVSTMQARRTRPRYVDD